MSCPPLTGTAVAYLAAATLLKTQLSDHLNSVPTPDRILIHAGLPAIAAAGGWVFADREPSGITRQPIE